MLFRLALGALLGLVGSVAAQETPLQGVFVLSNEIKNEVASYKIDDDGNLEFVAAYETGGIGHPRQTLANNETGQGFTSANHGSYHIYGGAQWYVGGNMGGVDMESSISIFKVNPDLTMELTDNVNCTRSETDSFWANSVTSFEDRTCVLGGGTNVLLECYRISSEGKLTLDYSYDFGLTIDPLICEAGHSGTASLQFSPDGTKLAALSKGSVENIFPFAPIPNDGPPNELGPAGLYVFPVLSEGDASYGDPIILEIDINTRPYDFVWNHPSSDRIYTIGLPSGLVPSFITQGANGLAISVSDTEVSVIDDFQMGFNAACWIEYYSGFVYTSNFNTNNDITIIPVQDDGSLDIELRNITLPTGRVIFINDEDTQPIPPAVEGEDSGPLDFEITGNKLDGRLYMIVQAHFANQVVSLEINEDGSLTEVDRIKIRDPDPMWMWFSSVTVTTADEQELIDLYASATPAPTPEDVVPEDPGILPGEIPFAGPGPGKVITGTYRDTRCIPSVIPGAGGMILSSQHSPEGCQYRDSIHFKEPFDTPSEDGGNCTGEPIVRVASDRALFYDGGEMEPWNMSAVAIRDHYTPLNDDGVQVMEDTCPVISWEVGVTEEALPCNVSSLVFTYLECRTFYVLAEFNETSQIAEFRAGSDFVRCDPETRTTREEDDTPSRNLKISEESTITRGCVVPGYVPPSSPPTTTPPTPTMTPGPSMAPGTSSASVVSFVGGLAAAVTSMWFTA